MSKTSVTAEPLFIDDLRTLVQFCESLRDETILALDTEFIPEHTYSPQLELVQIAARDGRIAVVDYGTIGRVDHDPLMPLLVDPKVLKVFHAAHGDLLVLQPLAERRIGPIWDTQLVTKLFDYRGGARYGAVVETLLGERVASGQSLTDWSKRPLTSQQLRYAAEDVRYLIPVYDVERGKLQRAGRLAWAEEECARLTMDVADSLASRMDERALYRNVRGAQSLDRRSLAILRELAMWRDREARARNKPARNVFKDDMLVQVARRAPHSLRQLGEFRAIQPRDLDKLGAAILQAIELGKRVPESECPPAYPSEAMLSPQETALASLLSAVLQQLAHKHRVASTMIATMDDLQKLVEAHLRGDATSSDVMQGWRGELVGRELMTVLRGEAAVRWDEAAGSLRVEARAPSA